MDIYIYKYVSKWINIPINEKNNIYTYINKTYLIIPFLMKVQDISKFLLL